MSLLSSFDTGVSGLHAAQFGLNTTSHNLANTKTAGYTRQQNIQRDTYYNFYKRTDKATMQIGSGVTVGDVRQIRDLFLDKEYRKELGKQNFYDVQLTTEQEIEDILGEMEGVEFQNSLDDLFNIVQDLSTNPESITNRELFISQLDGFIEQATNVYQALRDYQVNLNSQIEEQVKSINKIADQIAQLNLQIAKVESSHLENANDLRDKRNLLLDQLANYIPFDYYEEPNAMITVRVNNAPLVQDTIAYHMTTERIEAKVATGGVFSTTEQTEMLKVVWEKSGFGDVFDIRKAYNSDDESDRGSLLGILTARGTKYGYYTDIPKPEDYTRTKDYERAVKDYNNGVGNCLLEKVEAQFDLLIHKVVTTINDAFAPNVSLDGVSATDDAGSAVDLTAITDAAGKTYDLSKAKVLDAYRCPVGTDDDYTMGTEVIVRSGDPRGRYEEIEVSGPIYINGNEPITEEVTDASGNTKYILRVLNEEDVSDVNTLYTLQNIKVNEKILADYSYLPVKENLQAGNKDAYDWTIYTKLLESWRTEDTMLDPNALSKYSVDSFYDNYIGALATQGSIWKSVVENQKSQTDSIEDKRQQVGGVSTEEEMISLLMYQHAYNASSRYITVIDDMLEHVIERLG